MKDLVHTIEDALTILNPKGCALPVLAEYVSDASERDTIGTNNPALRHPAAMCEVQNRSISNAGNGAQCK